MANSLKTIYLENYQTPDHLIHQTDMEIHLDFQSTLIHTRHQVRRSNNEVSFIVLDYEDIQIEKIAINKKVLAATEYSYEGNRLSIACVLDEFEIEISNIVDPSSNTVLSGLYQSQGMLCTQCEAEGFRRITPSIDRPDNLSVYTVKLIADKALFPVLLSNGNLVDQGKLEDKHYVVWHDPFPKPTYLFAVVAGQLSYIEDTFTTQSGSEVSLKFFTREEDRHKCGHAMSSLKRSMKWDQHVYGREYDLDFFNVVAVSDFNMGAMENKGLNIFNTECVLADIHTATDADYVKIEGIIGHEYFHNWSGNRVTCRDWFQLSLKEGFTVFRDQEFSADMGSRGVKRIDDVNVLRTIQFSEDASPLAHPVKPDNYQEINNFYTATIYNKGAEIVRMQHILLGSEKFRQATDLYFDRFDGQAVTTDDFVNCMQQVSKVDMTQFKNWYTQPGTPHVHAEVNYDQINKVYSLNFSQSVRNISVEHDNKPFVIPIKCSLLKSDGSKFFLNEKKEEVLILDMPSKEFIFNDIDEPPTPSILRDFSAPITLDIDLSDDQLIHLLRYDNDPFVRWEAVQKIYTKYLLAGVDNFIAGCDVLFPEIIKTLIAELITSKSSDNAFVAKLLALPNIKYFSERCLPINPKAIRQVYDYFMQTIAESNKYKFQKCYEVCDKRNTGIFNDNQVANRCLRDVCLGYLSKIDDAYVREVSQRQLQSAQCMTDKVSALTTIANSSRSDKQTLLQSFYDECQHDPLITSKWLRIQATVVADETLTNVSNLVSHPSFDSHNPNKVYALILAFTHTNESCFHAEDGAGYEFASQWIRKLDKINPQVAARLAGCFNGHKKYIPELQTQILKQLTLLGREPNLSNNVREIIEKSLG